LEQVEKIKGAAREASKLRTQRRAEDRKMKLDQVRAGLSGEIRNVSARPANDNSETAWQLDAGYRERVEWVLKHLGYKHCPGGADEATKVIWAIAKQDERAFMDKYLPLLMKREGESETQNIEGERQDREIDRIVNDLLKRRKVHKCMKCGGKGWDDGVKRLDSPDIEGGLGI
jgi:hypothetical protein